MKFADGSALINDTYNSSPGGVAGDDRRCWRRLRDYRRRILVVGEMRELGTTSAGVASRGGEVCGETGQIECVFGVAGDARADCGRRGCGRDSAGEDEVFFFVGGSGEIFGGFVDRGDVLLVKGSRGVKMERVVEALMDRFAPASRDGQGERQREEARH